MSGVLHPVGPEPVQVYWFRRIIVLASTALALVLVIAVAVNLNSAANASGPEAVPPPVGSTSAPVPSTSAVTATQSVAPSTSGSSVASAAATLSAGKVPTAEPSKASSSATASSSAKAGSSAKPSTKVPPAEVAACRADQLRPTLTGKQNVKVKANTNLDLSLINGGTSTCQLTLNSDNFSLTIYSGKDRIWSTADCTDLVKPTAVKIASEDAYEWRLVWDGRRSKKSCKSRPEVPKPGTYIATAQFKGADPVRFRMFVHK